MTQVISPSDPQVRDFSAPITVSFKVDADVFYGVTGIPALSLLEFGMLYEGLAAQDMAHQPEAFTRMFDLVLTDESAERFKARMSDKTNPVTMTQLMDILPWLMEQYGMRPTSPSSNSSDGSQSPDDGMSLTDKQPAQVLTHELSQPTDS